MQLTRTILDEPMDNRSSDAVNTQVLLELRRFALQNSLLDSSEDRSPHSSRDAETFEERASRGQYDAVKSVRSQRNPLKKRRSANTPASRPGL